MLVHTPPSFHGSINNVLSSGCQCCVAAVSPVDVYQLVPAHKIKIIEPGAVARSAACPLRKQRSRDRSSLSWKKRTGLQKF